MIGVEMSINHDAYRRASGRRGIEIGFDRKQRIDDHAGALPNTTDEIGCGGRVSVQKLA